MFMIINIFKKTNLESVRWEFVIPYSFVTFNVSSINIATISALLPLEF